MPFIQTAYCRVLKPILFRIDPEKVHDAFTVIGKILGKTKPGRFLTAFLFGYQSPMLSQTLLGIPFKNPVGLSAGFDKDAHLVQIMPSVGFGFEEVGSVTGLSCKGNQKPRLWRLPKSRGLIVNYGLKNDGCDVIRTRLEKQRKEIPIGISIAKTNSKETVETEAGIADYEKAFRTLHNVADYITVNISCPNAFGGDPFSNPTRLNALLSRLDAIPTSKPIFVKLPADITTQELDALVAVMKKHRVHGIVVSNLTKRRDHETIDQDELKNTGHGGISGKPTQKTSNELIAHLFKTTGKQFVIVGVGGVSSALDAYEKIRCGASLVQLITGMIFEGPQLIGDINRGLVKLLLQDGFTNISEAVGSGVEK